MNLIIFGGFLGSGKTSFILSLAHFLVEKQGKCKSEVVIIENEIGETGIDDKVFKSEGFNVKELFSGCICCQLTADLTLTLNELAKTLNPAWVILEATGLAYPSKILDTLHKYSEGLESISTVTIVDAERWEELSEVMPILIETQVRDGEIVIINKIDLITNEQLKLVESDIIRINPEATIYKLSATGSVAENIWERLTKAIE